MSSVSAAAVAKTAAVSAARRRNIDHRGNDQRRAEQRPGANVAHQRRDAGMREQELDAAADRDLTRRQQRRAADETQPPARQEGGDPEREEQAELERGQEPQCALWILEAER